jgi:aryl-alcohol dehydrogenase-like predicted oxidoreductase
MSRLTLGTAQFGLDYGITNPGGRVQDEEVAAILALAAHSGIDTVDTARLYGESEASIGRNSPAGADFRIVTKTPKFGNAGDAAQAADDLRDAFETSLQALGRASVYALLLHDPQDLLGPFGTALWAVLEDLKQSGQVAKIGVSAYEGSEIDAALDLYSIDVVQLPFNAIDQRLAEGGQLDRLHRAGVEIHARSVFLQGLLLAPFEAIPRKFEPVRSTVERIDKAFADRGLSRLEGLLASVFTHHEIDRVVVGVTSTQELDASISAAKRAEEAGPLHIDVPPIDPRYLNPARWNELPA